MSDLECPNCGYKPKSGEAVSMTCDMRNYICLSCDKQWPVYEATDQVNSPQHYADHYPFEVCDAIEVLLNGMKSCNNLSPYQAYCLGNELKYRLRAGFKEEDKIEQDIKKALWYNKARRE